MSSLGRTEVDSQASELDTTQDYGWTSLTDKLQCLTSQRPRSLAVPSKITAKMSRVGLTDRRVPLKVLSASPLIGRPKHPPPEKEVTGKAEALSHLPLYRAVEALEFTLVFGPSLPSPAFSHISNEGVQHQFFGSDYRRTAAARSASRTQSARRLSDSTQGL
ncbi:hypothetical protein DPEC_G00244820 [Dallia pectoralis]|uniref:Uncharacterized protein n=1 Tax=Dallia pectoralis TaxID=75939 RepID=A0ACC2FVZ4_DALPE|nr:hypothetical protein DPEC_G00244820 [Dallia pectoralis]